VRREECKRGSALNQGHKFLAPSAALVDAAPPASAVLTRCARSGLLRHPHSWSLAGEGWRRV
jgi:hypothetical protein